MSFLSSPKIVVSIKLQENVTVLRGAVVTTIVKDYRVRSIRTHFRGRMRVWWSKGTPLRPRSPFSFNALLVPNCQWLDGEPHQTT
jgi:hypothetical protein